MRDWNHYVRDHLSLPKLDESRARDIEREVAADLEDIYREALVRGCSEEEADARARAHIPDFDAFAREVTAAQQKRRRPAEDRWADASAEALRERGRRWSWAADLLQDLRYAFRSLRKSPVFTTVALVTLALGIGGVTTIFTLYDQVLLRPLPYPDSHEIVLMWEKLPAFEDVMVSYPNYQDWRERNRVFEDVGVWNSTSASLTGAGDPITITAARISASIFPILGVEPALGRNFTADEDRVGGPPVVILTHGFWMARFGGDKGVLGKTITLDDRSYSVVGVMPADFRFPYNVRDVDLYLPVEQFAARWIERRGLYPVLALARLRDGVTLEAAQEDMERVAVGIEAEHPDTNKGDRVHVARYQDRVTRRAKDPLALLLLSVGFLLLIACMNVANLVLARTTSRMPEMAVRTSLGAGRSRILRLLLTDSLVLWMAGGVLGILLAVYGVQWVASLMADELPWIYQVGLDTRVVLAALGISLVTGVAFGLTPAHKVSRQDLKEFLTEGLRTAGGRTRARFRAGLVVAEVGLAVALLVGAGLTLRSFKAMSDTSPGLDPANVLTVGIDLPGTRYGNPEVAAFHTQLLDRVRALPGVASAATSWAVPMGPGGFTTSYHPEGAPPETGGQYAYAAVNIVSTDYFATMGIPLIRGRGFTRADDLEVPPVIIVDEALADEYWPDEDPIGKRIKWGGYDSKNPWQEVVGVVGEVAVNGVTKEAWHQIYMPYRQQNRSTYSLMVKTRGEPLNMVEAVRRTVLALDPALPLGTVSTMDAWVAATTRSARLIALLMTIFSLAAVLLAAVGVYGVMAQMTGERRHEIGIRVALGARRRQVLTMVLRQGLVTAGSGALLGLVLAGILGRLVSAQLYQISATDPLTFVLAPVFVVLVATVANLLPARRAMAVDPVRALQAE